MFENSYTIHIIVKPGYTQSAHEPRFLKFYFIMYIVLIDIINSLVKITKILVQHNFFD